MSRMKKYLTALGLLLVCLFCVALFQDWGPWKLDIGRRLTSSLYFQSHEHSKSNDTEDDNKCPETSPHLEHSKSNDTEDDNKCPETSPHLVGPVNINLSIVRSLEELSYAYPNVQGGHFHPADCSARQRIAVIIPFRRRETHLAIWLFYMHQFLQRQQADYGIYVIEQYGDLQFNRAKLMNVGFAEASKDYSYTCFVFSDIDIVPMDDRNYYRCYGNPRHMANAVDKFNFRLLYDTLFGGVTAFSKEQFLKVNGFSNKFWGWGGEDDELYLSVHLIAFAKSKMHEDGVNSCRYTVVNVTRHQLYTKISVDIGRPEDDLEKLWSIRGH